MTVGEFLDIVVPARLIMTQTVPGMPAAMTVTIEFIALGQQYDASGFNRKG